MTIPLIRWLNSEGIPDPLVRDLQAGSLHLMKSSIAVLLNLVTIFIGAASTTATSRLVFPDESWAASRCLQ